MRQKIWADLTKVRVDDSGRGKIKEIDIDINADTRLGKDVKGLVQVIYNDNLDDVVIVVDCPNYKVRIKNAND